MVFTLVAFLINIPLITHAQNATDTVDATGTVLEEPPSELQAENTTTQEETGGEDPQETIIETGDAVAEGDVLNTVNTNITDTNGTTTVDEEDTQTEETSETTDATSTEEGDEELAGEESVDDGGTDIEVESNNDAVVENNVTTTAETGENEAEGNEGDVIIDTGNAYATANVINVVNTNIFNSQGFIVFLNNFMNLRGDVDLRDTGWFDAPEGSGDCGLYECQSISSTNITNDNSAEITNSVVVRSSTGENSINGSGNAGINTGNAYAVANVVNIANTNIVDSNYLLLTFNNFGNWSGDLVFPAKSFFKKLFKGMDDTTCDGGDLEVKNNNSAEIENNVETTAETGENEVESDEGTAIIETGNAGASANVINKVNTNILCDTSFAIVFKIHGNWAGKVFGAPDNVYWTETGDGLKVFGDGLLGSQDEGRGEDEPGCSDCEGDTNIGNNNSAGILNNVNVIALTGKNKIENSGNGEINTGNAYAAANIVNVTNTNVVGRNWILAIVNIFGDWNGNVSFGKPDLWVGVSAEVPRDPARRGDNIVYNFTIINNGDADATDVRLRSIFDKNSLVPKTGDYDEEYDNEVSWSLGTIPAGGSTQVSFGASVSPNIRLGRTTITNSALIESFENDENTDDNTDVITILAQRGNSGIKAPRREPPPRLLISKGNAAEGDVNPGDAVDYEVTLINDGLGSAFNTVLTDTLNDANGNVINEETWDLGEVLVNEEITITYTVVFNLDADLGTYTNHAQATALSGFANESSGLTAESDIAESSINMVTEIGRASCRERV